MNKKYKPKNYYELRHLIAKNDIKLSDIDTSSVTNMAYLFYGIYRTDFSGIENWNVSNVTNMSHMFYKCYNFNINLSNWDINKVRDMESMFNGCKELSYQMDWNLENKQINNIYLDCENLN